jgi:hypothetical protein
MRIFSLVVGVTLLAGLTVGCETVSEKAPRFHPAIAPPDGYAVVYLYRFDAPPYTRTIKFSMTGKPLLDAPERAYTWVYAKAGTHTVIGDWPNVSGWTPASTTFTVESGKSYFVRAVGRLERTPGGFFSGSSITPTSYVTNLPPNVGLAEITACCRYMRAAIDYVE